MVNDLFVAALSLAVLGLSGLIGRFLDHLTGISLVQERHEKVIGLLKADCRSIRRELDPPLEPYPYDHL